MTGVDRILSVPASRMVKVATPLESTVASAWVEDTRVFMGRCWVAVERVEARRLCVPMDIL
jgi:hypothetical protein